jgi:predicted metal-dependent HD superfamily phosphohydrolase
VDLPWPLPERTDVRDRLVTAYAGERGYHDLRHLHEVLARLDQLGVADDVEIVLAAWFHDAVYDGAPGAEERSAQLAATELDGCGVDVDEVVRLVRLTESHDPGAGDGRGVALCDADLAILAAAPDRYAEYTAGVREEYADLSDAEFRAGRLTVLRDLATRGSLFGSAYAREHWESRARENLRAEIEALGG